MPTARLRFRDWTLEDVPAAFAIYSDPAVCTFIRPQGPVASLQEQAEYIQGVIERYAAMREGFGAWAIEIRECQTIVGMVVLRELPGHEGTVEVGWHLGRAYWGQGYATESAASAMDLGFDHLGLDRIVAVIDPRNLPSQAVAKRLGMIFAGPIRAFEQNLEHFEMTAANWRARNQ